MILNFKLIMVCLGCGFAYLLLLNIILGRLEKILPLFEKYPKAMIEQNDMIAFIYTLVIEFVFYVMIPSVIYSWFYTLIPFSGVRGGISVGLIVFILGALPIAISLLFRIKLPVVYLLYHALSVLLKIAGALAIIGYLYSL